MIVMGTVPFSCFSGSFLNLSILLNSHRHMFQIFGSLSCAALPLCYFAIQILASSSLYLINSQNPLGSAWLSSPRSTPGDNLKVKRWDDHRGLFFFLQSWGGGGCHCLLLCGLQCLEKHCFVYFVQVHSCFVQKRLSCLSPLGHHSRK